MKNLTYHKEQTRQRAARNKATKALSERINFLGRGVFASYEQRMQRLIDIVRRGAI